MGTKLWHRTRDVMLLICLDVLDVVFSSKVLIIWCPWLAGIGTKGQFTRSVIVHQQSCAD